MQRIQINKNLFYKNQSIKSSYSTNKVVPNGNIEQTFIEHSKMNNINKKNKDNKFLSIKERQKIIREINKSQNQFDLFKSSPFKNVLSRNNSNNKNILYVKKKKNLISRSNEKNSYEERKMRVINGINNISLKENKILVNKTKYIKNNMKFDEKKSNENKIRRDKYNCFNNDRAYYYLYEKKNCINNANNKNIYADEIYKKPINGVNTKKISVNLNKAYKKNKILSNISIINSAQKEKINCTKMMNTNGSKKTIFNMINNYNTQTIHNKDTMNDSNDINIIKLNINNEFFQRNNIQHKNNLKEINKHNTNNTQKYYFKNNLNKRDNNTELYTKKRSSSTNKNLNIKKPLYFEEGASDYLKQKYNYNENILTELNNDRIFSKNIKCKGKSIFNSLSFPKKQLYDTNLISNDLLNKLVEKDLISFTYNIDKFNDKNDDKALENKFTNNNKDYNISNKKHNKSKNKSLYINRNRKNNLSLSLSQSSPKLKRYKTVTIISDKDDEETIKDIRNVEFGNINQLKNIRNNSYKNFVNKLITKEVSFPVKVSRSISFYNSDEEPINSKNKKGKINEKNNLLFENRENNKNKTKKIANLYYIPKDRINNEKEQIRSQYKDYFFNYLSKKINNDILNEDKINKLGKDLYNIDLDNINKICEKCRRNNNHCHCWSSNNKIKNNKDLKTKYFQEQTIKTKNIHMNYKNNNNGLCKVNDFEKNNQEKNVNNQLMRNKSDLKLDISNGMHNSQNNNSNLININTGNDGSFNFDQFDKIETEINHDSKQDLNKKGNRRKNSDNIIKLKSNNYLENDETDHLKLISNNIYKEKQIKPKIEGDLNNDGLNNKIPDEKKEQDKNSYSKDEYKNNSYNTDLIDKEDIMQINNKITKRIKLPEQPIKYNFTNKHYQNISPLLPDILENINIISPKNYISVKNNILNLLINDDNNIPIEFANMLYIIAIKQIKFQAIYSKLFKDIDKYYNKKDKSKSVIRTQLMKLCKSNFKKIKVRIENIKYISSDINFIGELINNQMVSKKVGIQCLTHLFNKFNKYNDEKNLINRNEEKYLYLDNIINLLNKFGTCIFFYQKGKIRDNDLTYFENEINKKVEMLKEILKNKQNFDIPSNTRINLLELIKKADNDWKLTFLEQNIYNILKPIYENINDKNS